MSPLAGQVALVTGASRGFGRAVARLVAADGAHLIALARTTGGLEELDDEARAAGASATLVPLDLTDAAALPRLGAAIHERWGRLDLWVHTAAYAPPLQPAEHIAARELASALALNVTAFHGLIRVLDPLLRQASPGRVLVAADERAGIPFFGTYAASKAAQSVLAQAWAAESARRIAIAEVVPPPMPTALRARFHPGENRDALTPPAEAAERLRPHLAAPPEPGARIRL